MGEPAREGISTRLYPTPNEITNKYQAHILLTEDRKISKEEAVNELVLIGAKVALPKNLTYGIVVDFAMLESHKEQQPPAAGAKAKAGK